VKRATWALGVVALVAAGSRGPAPIETAADAARRWIHPKQATHVWYHFEVETEGLPKHMYEPPPGDIDVTYRDLDTGRLLTIRGVDADWMVGFRNPKFTRGRIQAVAHGRGLAWCVMEVDYHDASGWTVSEFGRRRCRVKRRF
jgi:hypothetical protein